MRIIITGITSFLGLNTARALINSGYDVAGVIRPGSKNIHKLQENDLERIKVIVSDTDGLISLNEKCDVMIHFAWDGVGSAGRADPVIQEKNLESSKLAYRAAEKFGCHRFIFAGSQAEYGKGTKTAPDPVSEYGKKKLAFGNWAKEAAASDPGMDFIHMRIFSIYGWGDHETSLVCTLIKAALKRQEMILGPCDQLWNYLEVRDCASAINLLAAKDKIPGGIYDIAGMTTKVLRDYVLEINHICDDGAKLIFGKRENNAEGRVDMDPDTGRIGALGFVPKIRFSDGIAELKEKIGSKIS